MFPVLWVLSVFAVSGLTHGFFYKRNYQLKALERRELIEELEKYPRGVSCRRTA